MIGVLILGEVGVHREGLSGSLAEHPRIEVVGVSGRLEDALTALDGDGAEIVLVDLPMPGAAEAVRALANGRSKVKVVALGVLDNDSDVIALAEAGVSGYVGREGSTEDLAEVVESVSRGEMPCSSRIAAALAHRVAHLARDRPLGPIEEKLTTRELEVLGLIEEGRSNKEIAAALSIEVSTVKNHVHNILQKLNVHSRTEAAARARRHGLPGPGNG